MSMDDELKKALADEGMASALRRLYHVRRLEELSAPQVVRSRAEEMLAEAKERVGDRMEVVERLYPLFAETEERDMNERYDWEMRCRGCKRWVSEDKKDLETHVWCQLFTYETRPYPEECYRFLPDD